MRARLRTPVAATALALLACCAGPSGDASRDAPPEIALPDLSSIEAEVGERLEEQLETVRTSPEDGAAAGHLGMLAQAHGLLPTARTCYLRARALQPERFDWAYLLARVERELGHAADAETALRDALEIDPSYVAGRVALGEMLAERGEDDSALAEFERALELDANSAAAHVGLARIAGRAGRQRDAVQHYERALELSPRATGLHYNLAQAYRRLGDTERAEEQLALRGDGRATQDDPLLASVFDLVDSARLWLDRARIHASAGEFERAAQALREALLRDPDHPTGHLLAGSVFDSLGDAETAARHYRRALELEPDNPRARFGLGLVLARSGDDRGAARQFLRAVELDPALSQARRSLARTYERTGEREGALQQYEILLRGDPLNAEHRLRRALCHVRLGRHAEALGLLERDVLAFPDEAAFAHTLARLLAASPDDAVRDGNRALLMTEELARVQRNTDLAETIAMALAELGRFPAALEWQTRAIDVATRAGRSDVVPRMRTRLALFREQRPCREPWTPDDPIFRPAPGT
ncbi:MAG: tetratricopeptide repeat protein [bacterium]|nr:tetratricopeptide repeat protein [bacterium]